LIAALTVSGVYWRRFCLHGVRTFSALWGYITLYRLTFTLCYLMWVFCSKTIDSITLRNLVLFYVILRIARYQLLAGTREPMTGLLYFIGADPMGSGGPDPHKIWLWGSSMAWTPRKFHWNKFNISKIDTRSGFVSL